YTSGEGSNDYAILDDVSELFAGSFHGGEVLLAESYIIDGTPTDPLGNINICETLEILQKTQIDWPDYKVADEAAMLAIGDGAGTIVLRADTGETWIHNGGSTGTI